MPYWVILLLALVTSFILLCLGFFSLHTENQSPHILARNVRTAHMGAQRSPVAPSVVQLLLLLGKSSRPAILFGQCFASLVPRLHLLTLSRAICTAETEP